MIDIQDIDGIMMKSYTDLMATLTYLNALAVATPIPYGSEGIAFTPPDTGPYTYATVLPVSNDQSLQTVDKYIRMLQIDCFDEMNIGTGRLKKGLVGQILAYYKPRRLFANTANTQKLRIKRSQDNTVRIYGGYQQVALTITFDGSVDRAFS